MTDPFDRMLALIDELVTIEHRRAELERQMLREMSECMAEAVEVHHG